MTRRVRRQSTQKVNRGHLPPDDLAMAQASKPKMLKRLLSYGQPKVPKPKPIPKAEKRFRVESEDAAITRRRKTETDFFDKLSEDAKKDETLSGLLDFTVCGREGEPGKCLLVVTNKELCDYGPAKNISRYRLVVSVDGEYYIQGLLRTIEEGKVSTPEDFRKLCEKISDITNYKLCPGIPMDEYQKYRDVIQHELKNVRFVDFPFKAVESAKCKRLYVVNGHRITFERRREPLLLCDKCYTLQYALQRAVNRIQKAALKAQEQQGEIPQQELEL